MFFVNRQKYGNFSMLQSIHNDINFPQKGKFLVKHFLTDLYWICTDLCIQNVPLCRIYTCVVKDTRYSSLWRRLESLFKIAGMKFKFWKLEIRFHKREVSFLVVKTVKCKRGKNSHKDLIIVLIFYFILFMTIKRYLNINFSANKYF